MIYIIEIYENYEMDVRTFSTKIEAEVFITVVCQRGGDVMNVWKGVEVEIREVEHVTKHEIVE